MLLNGKFFLVEGLKTCGDSFVTFFNVSYELNIFYNVPTKNNLRIFWILTYFVKNLIHSNHNNLL